ncbi:protein rep [uncultured Kordia sp.]|uniref:protein rep n=1 Tax=uncultured Kordia sp. TaxID=507699 RepID=UPI00260AD1F2|nr:protein rep [uncultured Kordia sp.]
MEHSAKQIYTLAQSVTANEGKKTQSVQIAGNGTEMIGNESLLNRAQRKTISRAMLLSLIDVAKEKGATERTKSYWNAYYCCTKLIQHNNRLHANYCKTRYCTICNAIRKADKINKYYPVLKNWENPYFVTLTLKTVKANALRNRIYEVKKAFKTINNKFKKRYQRGKGMKIIGIKSLECNFNPKDKTYNPHYHLIVPNRQTAILLKQEWKKQWNRNGQFHCSNKAQHFREVESLERDLIETIKYGTKVFTEPDPNNKKRIKKDMKIYTRAMDNINAAFKGKRIFDRFGFNLPQQEEKEANVRSVENYKLWEFAPDATDWINTDTGECLTGYNMPIDLKYLLSECIDIDKE